MSHFCLRTSMSVWWWNTSKDKTGVKIKYLQSQCWFWYETWLRERSGRHWEKKKFIQFIDKHYCNKRSFHQITVSTFKCFLFKQPTILITKYATTFSSRAWCQLWLCFGLGHLLKQEGFSWGILYLNYTRTCVLQFQKIILSMKRIQHGNLKPVKALAAPPFKSNRCLVFCASCSCDFIAAC